MPCDYVKLPDGFALVKRARRANCEFCNREHTKLCDFQISVGSVGHKRTCDAKMCDGCATSVGDNLDYCPEHKGETPRQGALDLSKEGGTT